MTMTGSGYAQAELFYGVAMPPARLSALIISALAFTAPAQAAEAPAWDYIGGANDDEDWGAISPAYAKCTIGTEQSPVAIDEAKKSSMLPIEFSYQPSEVVEQWRDLTLLVQFSEGNNLRHEGVDYALKQIRFHTPTEHSVLGKDLPMEMQFIHESADKQVLIVAVQAQLGAANAAIQALVEHLPKRGMPEQKLTLDPALLLPEKRGYYAYRGSLSWPPCTEGVEWLVLKTPITVTREQLSAISHLTGRNARLPQPLYLRTIKESFQ